jgi:hypothetical protein
MFHPRTLLGALAVSTLVATGCGSSSNDAASTKPAPAKPAAAAPAKPAVATGPAPTKAEYVRKADRICRTAAGISSRANAQVKKAYAAKQVAAAAAVVERYTPLYAAEVHKFEVLRQPKKDTKLLGALVKLMKSQVTALNGTATALRQDDGKTLQQIISFQTQSREYAKTLATQYGFRVCGQVS